MFPLLNELKYLVTFSEFIKLMMHKITHDRKLATENVQFKQNLRMATIFANFKGVEELLRFHAEIQ